MVGQVFYYNQTQQYPQIQQDYKDVKKHVDKTESTDETVEKAALEAIPTFRRISSLPEKIQNGDYAPAIGLASLAVMNLPEDLKDVKAAGKQINAFLKGEKYKGPYEQKNYQHDFSFFRGTLLNDFVNPATTKHPKLAQKLLKWDVPLSQTSFGEKLLSLLGTKETEVIKTSIKNIGYTEANQRMVKARKFEGSLFGELTGRAMTRTTKLGVAVLAALELPRIFKAINQGNSVGEQTNNTIEQTVKSGINVASITAGIAYGGAIGSKYGKSLGSIVGMGVGAIVGATASSKVQTIFS